MRKRPVEPYFDQIVDLVESGHTFQSACEVIPGLPSLVSCYKAVKKHPEFAARLNEARANGEGRRPGLRFEEAAYTAALEQIVLLDDSNIQDWSVARLPRVDTMRQRARRDPEFAERLAKAMQERDDRLQRVRIYSEEDHRTALEIVKFNAGRPKDEVDFILRDKGLPKFETVRDRAKHSDSGMRAFKEAWGTRSSRAWNAEDCLAALNVFAAQPTRSARDLETRDLPTLSTVIVMSRTDPEVRKEYTAYVRLRDQTRSMQVGENLRKSLQHDELYREASKLFYRNHPDYDDMITEVLAAVYAGELSRENIKTKGAEIGWGYVNRNRNVDTDSFDAPFGGFDGAASLGETISTDNWSFEDAI